LAIGCNDAIKFSFRLSRQTFARVVLCKWAAIEGSNRVLRGGSWNNNAVNCRSANRNNNHPENRNHNYGFRLVFVPQLKGRVG
jgi:formylglycine-generating enzyme required for sulfatase activity